MNVAVLMKQVPDSDNVRMNPETGTMVREGTSGIVNPLDLNALEAAMSIRAPGDAVAIVSMGPPEAEESLREGLALGADRAILATDKLFAGGDSWATANVLAAVLKKIGLPDLIIAGEKATDGETGQVGPEVAALLGIPAATRVTRLDALSDGRGIEIDCTVEDGILTQRIELPCLVTVVSDINTVPLPTLSGKKRAYSSAVEVVSASDLSLSEAETGLPASPTRVVKIDHPKLTRRTERFMAKRQGELDAGLDRIVEILTEAAVI
ncbi:MAG: electron transfer flavoprotein subunit beta/FixA family protein [Synergistaceae bacterium]|jgi:electron transfer flavoprotein beta subunit|nr:electron transfer flavoprotein subunit beta/FixA family protein [Synergistaceae bacterium]